MTWNCTLTSLIVEHSWLISSEKSFAGKLLEFVSAKTKQPSPRYWGEG
ncbi:hypothetical protein MKY95_30660 [Paenibacillus sp. FSL P4-0176]|nr:hypothetical protein [Paenibacillus sp. FSL R5-192]